MMFRRFWFHRYILIWNSPVWHHKRRARTSDLWRASTLPPWKPPDKKRKGISWTTDDFDTDPSRQHCVRETTFIDHSFIHLGKHVFFQLNVPENNWTHCPWIFYWCAFITKCKQWKIKVSQDLSHEDHECLYKYFKVIYPTVFQSRTTECLARNVAKNEQDCFLYEAKDPKMFRNVCKFAIKHGPDYFLDRGKEKHE